MTTSPLCKCAYITTDSTLNFSLSYRSHLVAQAGLGCLPCPASCLDCLALNFCTACMDEYVLINGSCVGCSINCKKCRVSNLVISGLSTTTLQCY